MAERVSVIGAGSWGLAIARLLQLNGAEVTLWVYDPGDFRRLQNTRSHEERLPRFVLPDDVLLTTDIQEAARSAEVLVLAVPSQFLRSVLKQFAPIRSRVSIINLAKGIEHDSLKRMSELITEVGQVPVEQVVTLSGPSHAEEVALDLPTTVVAAGTGRELTEQVQGLFSSPYFRVYTSNDLIGVELGGSLKNIIAIAAGIADGLGFGDNTKGALLTRGLAEMVRLGVTLGADAATFAGLSGVGDLIATCTSKHSRNREVGERIGRGEKLDDILRSMTMVAEGVETTRSGFMLARRHGVEMPITSEMYKVLFDQLTPAEAVANLMGRSLKAEFWR